MNPRASLESQSSGVGLPQLSEPLRLLSHSYSYKRAGVPLEKKERIEMVFLDRHGTIISLCPFIAVLPTLTKVVFRNTKKGLVYFHSIRAKWNKKISVKATVKPCIPSNRVFGGSTFDFR